jgi:hypothetical protein
MRHALLITLALAFAAVGALYWTSSLDGATESHVESAAPREPSRDVASTSRDPAARAVENPRAPVETTELIESDADSGAVVTLSVLVVDAEAQKPVPDARVWIEREGLPKAMTMQSLLNYGSDVAELEFELGRELDVDATGTARTRSPGTAVRVAARAEGLAGSTVVARGDTQCTLALAASHDVEVRVRDDSGRPIEGVLIAVGRQSGGEIFPNPPGAQPTTTYVSWVGRTSAAGTLMVYDVDQRIDSGTTSHTYWWIGPLCVDAVPRHTRVDVGALPASLEFVVARSGGLRIELVDREGRPRERDGVVQIAVIDTPRSLYADGMASTTPHAVLRGGRATFSALDLGRSYRIDVRGERLFVHEVVEGPTRAGETVHARLRVP